MTNIKYERILNRGQNQFTQEEVNSIVSLLEQWAKINVDLTTNGDL